LLPNNIKHLHLSQKTQTLTVEQNKLRLISCNPNFYHVLITKTALEKHFSKFSLWPMILAGEVFVSIIKMEISQTNPINFYFIDFND